MKVNLTCSNAKASAPASVTIPAGSNSATFNITTSVVASSVTGNLTATLNGNSKSASLTVRPIGVKSALLTPDRAKGGSTLSCTVTLEESAAPGNIVVSFQSDNTAAMPSPASITIPAGHQSATFTVKTNAVSANTTVILSATANQVTKTGAVVLTP